MSTLLATVAAASALLLIVLAVPVDLGFRVRGIEAFEGRFTLGWLFGLVRLRVRVPDPKRTTAPTAPPRQTSADAPVARAEPRSRRGHGRALSMLRDAAWRRRVWRLARDLARAVHVRELALHLRLGLGDPADTGRLWAVVGPLHGLAQGMRHAQVMIEPDFVDAAFEFEARGRLRLVPLELLALGLAFVLSPASIRAWRKVGAGDA